MNSLQNNIIAERTLSFLNGNKQKSLRIELGKPEKVDSDEWRCAISIDGKIQHAHGIDSFQALILALKMISIKLNTLKGAYKGLNWLGSDDLGFGFTKGERGSG